MRIQFYFGIDIRSLAGSVREMSVEGTGSIGRFVRRHLDRVVKCAHRLGIPARCGLDGAGEHIRSCIRRIGGGHGLGFTDRQIDFAL